MLKTGHDTHYTDMYFFLDLQTLCELTEVSHSCERALTFNNNRIYLHQFQVTLRRNVMCSDMTENKTIKMIHIDEIPHAEECLV